MELNYKLFISQVAIFSVIQINKSGCHTLTDENNNEREVRGEKQIRRGGPSYLLSLPKTSLKALRQGEIQLFFSLNSTRIIKTPSSSLFGTHFLKASQNNHNKSQINTKPESLLGLEDAKFMFYCPEFSCFCFFLFFSIGTFNFRASFIFLILKERTMEIFIKRTMHSLNIMCYTFYSQYR